MIDSGCPRCAHGEARRLEACSELAQVDYYICVHCDHVWTLRKNDPDATPQDVTVDDDQSDSA